jgi:hypothetical protein
MIRFGGVLPSGQKGKRMNRVNGAFLYDLGAKIHPLVDIRWNSTGNDVMLPILIAEGALTLLLWNVDFFRLRTSVDSANRLLSAIRTTKEHVEKMPDRDQPLSFNIYYHTIETAKAFETVFNAELNIADLYIVAKRAAYDMTDLIENGQVVFPKDLTIKVPEAIIDIRFGTKCIAFDLPTAAAFHFHRANESVLHKYYDCVTNGAQRPKSRNLGDYLNALDKHNVGDDKVKSALKDLKDLHRNPIAHPEEVLGNTDEAIALMGQVNAVITFMLKEIPAPANALTNALGAIAASTALSSGSVAVGAGTLATPPEP